MPKLDIITKNLREVIDQVWNRWGRCELVAESASVHDMEVFNAALGLAGEAGEVCDLLKKSYFHEPKKGRREQLMLEIYDVYFYLSKIQDLFGFTTEEIMEAGKEKLFERHGVKE